MAALLQSSSDILGTKQVFMPQETLDHPCDVTLVVEDGKEFKAHRHVLSEASPYFEKLLNIDMKESKEGLVRLEMLTEPVLSDMLEFIYTGRVQISAANNAQDLIMMADYLFLPDLKAPAGRFLAHNLNTSSCISTYHCAKQSRCSELVSVSESFILANFTSVAKTEEFLNVSGEELKSWISSDKICVSAEEDVFKIILYWISGDKLVRKKYFQLLFRQVRLVYVSRDFLYSDIVTNEFVKFDKYCLSLVKGTMKVIDRKVDYAFEVKPRKSLATRVVITCMKSGGQILCYFPREDSWYKLGDNSPSHSKGFMFSCRGRLYFICCKNELLRYDSFSNSWTTLPFEERRRLLQVIATNGDEVYALMTENRTCGKPHPSAITKYKPKSNSWENVTSFDLKQRQGICIVANDNFIYFLGGGVFHREGPFCKCKAILTRDADRYELSKDKWEKIADLRTAKWGAKGAAAGGKIFITGGIQPEYDGTFWKEDRHFGFRFNCEMYDETTNEWQAIADLSVPNCGYTQGCMMGIDGEVYVLGVYLKAGPSKGQIESYDPEKNEWSKKTDIPLGRMFSMDTLMSCNMDIFKGSKFIEHGTNPVNPL